MALDFAKPVRTRNGCKVLILRTDGVHPYPVEGLILRDRDNDDWDEATWTCDGRYTTFEPSGSDLAQAEQPAEPAENIDPAQFRPGSYGAHEALHMASVFADMVDRHLCEHPTVVANEAWTALANRAADALHDLYQAIGAEHMGAIPEPPADAPEPQEWR